jgi:hypothetical protein
MKRIDASVRLALPVRHVMSREPVFQIIAIRIILIVLKINSVRVFRNTIQIKPIVMLSLIAV